MRQYTLIKFKLKVSDITPALPGAKFDNIRDRSGQVAAR